MNFQIKQGLFSLDCIDYHAMLGISINANPDEIRKRYKEVAFILHPDSSSFKNPLEKEQAIQLFAKFVTPAYSELSKPNKRTEHSILLKRITKLLAADPKRIKIYSKIAHHLLNNKHNYELIYQKAAQQLAEMQYKNLEKSKKLIGTFSELNAVYLIQQSASIITDTVNQVEETAAELSPDQTPQTREEGLVEPYVRRAAVYLMKNDFSKAVLELREALKLEPNNSHCHALIGMVYLKQNLLTMARVHINKALQLNPQEPQALQGKELLKRFDQQFDRNASTSTSKPSGENPSSRSGGGLFNGLFGGNKKS